MQDIQELIELGVLTPVRNTVPLTGGTVVICDGETDPALIVPRNNPSAPLRVIANETGVFACTEPNIAIDPLKRAFSDGFGRVILVVNLKAIWGKLSEVSSIELIRVLMLVQEDFSERLNRFEIECIVHVPHDINAGGGWDNYRVNVNEWRAWYDKYELDVLGVSDDPEFAVVEADPDDDAELEELAFGRL